MLDFFSSWYGLLLGGGLTTFIVLVGVLRWAGVSAEPIVSLLSPLLRTVGEKLADFVGTSYDVLKDGGAYIGQSVKALVFLVTCCAVVAGLVYFPTKHKAEKRGASKQVTELRKNYRFVPKKKAAPKQWIPSPFTYKGP